MIDNEIRTKDIERRFAELEKRIKALVAENHRLKERIPALEKERDRASTRAQESHQARDMHAQIRERVERVLRSLESIDHNNGEE